MSQRAGGRGRFAARSVVSIVAAVVLLAACTPSDDAEVGSTTVAEGPRTELMGSLAIDPVVGRPGTVVGVTGEGFAPDTEFSLTWGSYDGTWLIEGDAGEEYHGRQFTPTVTTLSTVTTDGSGALSTEFGVPEDLGFGHDVRLVDPEGVVRNQAAFVVDMQVTISPESGPPGTPITIRVSGLGVDALEGNRQILYDNRYTGWMSAVTTKGPAVAVIPATGGPGPHRIEVARGAFTFPYLNPAQSPRPDILVYDAVFTVTAGDPVLPPSIDEQTPQPAERTGFTIPESGPWLTTDVEAGPAGTPIVVSGGGPAPGTAVSLTWYRIVGNRVAGLGWEEQGIDFGAVTAGSDGSFEMAAEVPGDVGGPHRLEAFVDGTAGGATSVRINPAVDAIPQTVAW